MPELNELANANAELDKTVDELSKPENEAELNKALTEELGEQEGEQPADKTPEDQPENQSKDENLKNDKKEDQPSSVDESKEKKPDKFKELLEERNEAKDTAAEAETRLTAAEKIISDLEEKISELESGNSGEGETSADDSEPLTKKQVEKMLADRQATEQQKAATEKARTAEVESLQGDKNFPQAEQFKDQIVEMMETKNINAKLAYYAMKGAGIITGDESLNSSNANKLNTGDKAKANLIKEKNPKNMSPEELDKAVREGVDSGDIIV